MVATQIFFIFTPKIGEDSHFDSYFSKGLVQPPTSDTSLKFNSSFLKKKMYMLEDYFLLGARPIFEPAKC